MKVKDYFLTGEEFDINNTSIEGILKTYPIPTNLSDYYESEKYISHHQDKKTLKEKIYKYSQKFNLNYKKNIICGITNTDSKILDYGCGAGDFITFIENDFQTFAYEPNKIARETTKKKTKRTKVVEDLNDIEDNSLDVITLWHVLEHITNQEEILNEFYKKLKPSGKLILALPNHLSYDAKHYRTFWAAYDVPRHVYHFSKKGILNLFTTENWKLIKTKPLYLDAFYISILSEKYKKNPLFFLKGSIIGAISNFKASKTGDFSSLIYIIEKK